MFVCLCKGLDDKSLEKMRQDGTDTLKKVIKKCGAGGDCGSCAFKINRLLQEGNERDSLTQELAESPVKKAK